jgi:hypothetical protein
VISDRLRANVAPFRQTVPPSHRPRFAAFSSEQFVLRGPRLQETGGHSDDPGGCVFCREISRLRVVCSDTLHHGLKR